MKTDNETIARMARRLRDEENAQLHVAPWQRRHRHFHVPAWLVGLPAAALVGFLFGLWTNRKAPSSGPLTALVDTVYVTVEKPSTPNDTAVSMQANAPVTQPVAHPTALSRHRKASRSFQSASTTTGRSVADDRIRYDLLVKN